MKRVVQLILASQSPRRKELLDAMGLAGKYVVVPSDFNERLDDDRDPESVAKELGYGKALAVAQQFVGAWVIGSDTIVTINGKQLGKAQDEGEARTMLRMLAGQANVVSTSVALVHVHPVTQEIISHVGCESTHVHFAPYSQEAVDNYIASGKWRDMAGAYSIQSGTEDLIKSIAGNYDTVVGLPTHTLATLLSTIDLDARPAVLESPVPQQ